MIVLLPPQSLASALLLPLSLLLSGGATSISMLSDVERT